MSRLSNDLLGSAVVTVAASVDVAVVYMTAETSTLGAIGLAALSIFTLRLFARYALQEIDQ